MSVFTSAGPKRLFGFAAFAAVCVTLLFLSGCGHHCGCNKCNSCNTCNTCKTCGVSDASTCTTCNQYANVGTAPQTLSEPSSAYNTSSTYTGTNTSYERVGDSQNLPVFSAPITPTVVPPVYTPPVTPPVQQAALIPDPQVRGGGQYHTLAQGETIYALSRKYGVKPKSIIEANHFSDPNHLAIGTRVYIPTN
ncbi:MAG TPA: LysM domain-containing protein [Planctomycetota bacterium]|nr:LysM domain-containing protein [Planctomycetota bacterium]